MKRPRQLNRRQLLRASGVAAAAVGVDGVRRVAGAVESGAATAPAVGQPFALASAPVLLNPSADGVMVLVAVNRPATGWVEYGPTEAMGLRAAGSVGGLMPFGQRHLAVRLDGLAAGQTYHYRVHASAVDFAGAYSIHRGQEVQSDVYSFRTLDPAAPEATFTVWNDTHEHEATIRPLVAALAKSPTHFLMWNGDVCNDIADEAKVIGQFLRPQPYAAAVPLMFGRGNHDVRGAFARRLPEYVPGPAGEYFYAFRHGPVAFLVMDTGEDKPDADPAYAGLCDFAAYRAAQRAWLAKAIEEPQFRSAPYRVAFLHIPLVWEAGVPQKFTDTYKGQRGWVCDDGREKWHDLLVRGRVDLVISGHTHHHAWFAPTPQRPYRQLIGGGPQTERATIITARADAKRLNVVMTDLRGKELVNHEIAAGAARAV